MKGRVLLVDSIATNRIVLRSGLNGLTPDIWQAETAAEALDLAKAHQVHIVLSSMDLADSDMVDFFAELKALAARPLILAVTGAPIKARLAALEAGADSVMSHPVEQGLLHAKVRGLLRRLTPVTDDSLPQVLHGLFDPAQPFVGARSRFVGPIHITGPDATRVNLCRAQLEYAGIGALHSLDWPSWAKIPVGADQGATVLVVPPDTDAQDVTAWISEHMLVNAQAPLFVVTSRATSDLSVAAYDAGAQEVVISGVGLSELAHHLAHLLHRPGLAAPDRAFQTEQPIPRRPLRLQDRVAQASEPYAVLVCQINPPLAPEGASAGLRRDLETTDTLVLRMLRKTAPFGTDITSDGPGSYRMLLSETGASEARRVALRLCHEVAQTPIWMDALDTTTRFSLSVGIGLSHHALNLPTDQRAPYLVHLAQAAVAQPCKALRMETDVHFGRPAA